MTLPTLMLTIWMVVQGPLTPHHAPCKICKRHWHGLSGLLTHACDGVPKIAGLYHL